MSKLYYCYYSANSYLQLTADSAKQARRLTAKRYNVPEQMVRVMEGQSV